ncbi:MAG: redox-regulated ATPase YchF [Nitrospirae bacterium]|nr:redox-regulated ATPase YchF [Nitrospirota bacterium]
MRLALIGISNSGKTTIFNALTGQRIPVTQYPETTAGKPHIGAVNVPDSRLERLSLLFKPKKTTYTQIEVMDYIGFIKGDAKQNRAVLEHIKDADALLHVVRAFQDDMVIHPMGSIDPLRDIKAVESELLFWDFSLVDKRLESMEQSAKKGKKPDEEEKKVLLRFKDSLEKEIPLRDVRLTADEHRAIRHLQFLSIKPEVIVINLKEAGTGFREGETLTLSVFGKLEMELRELSPNEAKAFRDDMGIEGTIVERLTHALYESLGLISFFTVVGDEVRAWSIKRGETCLNAAGKVHSDMERGFIRAEVISFEDFMKVKDMAEAKSLGLLRLEGKTYVVKDGDIINFRFGV